MGKEKAEKIFHSKQVDAVILTSPANMRYMAGFCGEGYVYLSEKKQFLVTDSRYTIAAKKKVLILRRYAIRQEGIIVLFCRRWKKSIYRDWGLKT